MKRLLAGFIFIFLAVVLTGCPEPIGSIRLSEGGGGGGSGNGSGASVVDFYIIGLKTAYYVNSVNADEHTFFRRSDHVKVMGFGGQVDINDPNLKIEIFTDPLFVGSDVYAEITTTLPNNRFRFLVPGDYILKGSFNGLTDEHPFKVYGSPPEGGDGGAGVGMVWLD